MKIAITGRTGLVGRHLARSLAGDGHAVVIIARGTRQEDAGPRELEDATFVSCEITDTASLAAAFAGCEGVAHCAGISREVGSQRFQRIHVEGTRAVLTAAKQAGVKKVALTSFLRARPACGSPYHVTKWAAEELVRGSGMDYTVLKIGVIFGPGDQMTERLRTSLRLFPVFPLVGMRDRSVRPVAVEDVARVLRASLVEGRLSRQTVAVAGPEAMAFREVVRRVARVVGKRPLILPAPVWLHFLLAWGFERVMPCPLTSRSQVRMLAEGISEPVLGCGFLPEDLLPRVRFDEEQIRAALGGTKDAGDREA